MIYFASLQPLADNGQRPNALLNEQVYGYLRTDESEAELIDDLIKAAMSWAENFCQQALFAGTYKTTLPCFQSGSFPHFYNVAITGITYGTTAGNAALTLPDTHYQLSGYGLSFSPLTAQLGSISSVEITFTAGYAPNDLPRSIVQALRLVIADWYDNRADGKRAAPSASELLMQPFKRYTA